jgi:hypothetical protein
MSGLMSGVDELHTIVSGVHDAATNSDGITSI